MQQHKRIRIQMMLPHPHPSLLPQNRLPPHPHPPPKPFPFPHTQSKMMIQRMLHPQEPLPQLESPHPQSFPQPFPHPQLLLHPHPDLSSPHPQFVAAKSLMPETSRNYSQFIIWLRQGRCDKSVDRNSEFGYNKLKFNIFVNFETKMTQIYRKRAITFAF